MSSRIPTGGFRPVRRDQLRQERVHDSYRLPGKLPEPAVCRGCGVVYHAGRWQWGEAPVGASEVVCPACRRIEDRFPQGFVVLKGSFFVSHRGELMQLVRHHEEKAKAGHPLARIIAVEDEEGGVLITTTDSHLARDLGEALHHAYQGELEFHYNDADNLLRVHWSR